jgi:hypothetical protein
MNAPQAWPSDTAPSKAEIERIYKAAYYVNPSVLRPQDLAEFGLDLHRLKEFGEVRMKKPLSELRRHLPALWGRMDENQKALFLLGHLAEALRYSEDTLQALEKELGPLKEERAAIDRVMNLVYGKIPDHLSRRIKRGLGREWLNGKD